jgi:hypothetical protein
MVLKKIENRLKTFAPILGSFFIYFVLKSFELYFISLAKYINKKFNIVSKENKIKYDLYINLIQIPILILLYAIIIGFILIF